MNNTTIAVDTTTSLPPPGDSWPKFPPCFPCQDPSQFPGVPDCKIEEWSNDSLIGENVCPLPSSLDNGMRCPWVDVQEQHHGQQSDAISAFLLFVCLFTILANIVLFYIILSQRELRVQVILVFFSILILLQRNLQFLISIVVMWPMFLQCSLSTSH